MTTFTGNAISWYRWALIRGAIRLEMDGFPSRHFMRARPRILKELGLPPRTQNKKLLAAVEKKIEEAKRAIKPGEIEP